VAVGDGDARHAGRAAASPLNFHELADRLAFYTGGSFEHLQQVQLEAPGDGSGTVAQITIGPSSVPVGFAKSGAYTDPSDASSRQELFAAGSFYFRDDDVSRPGTTADMQRFWRRSLRNVSARWLREIRRVLNAPVELAELMALARAMQPSESSPKPVRIVNDPTAPALQPQDVDRLYPLRQKDLVRQLNRQFGPRFVNSYDIQAVRRQHRLDDRPDFVFHLPGAGRRYSLAAAEWIADQVRSDADFFHRVRVADHATLSLRRKKPR
jgi:hypothetical protein